MAKFDYKTVEPEEKTPSALQKINAGNVKRYTSKVGEIIHNIDKDTIFFKDYNLEIEANELKTNKDFFQGGKQSMEVRSALGLFGEFVILDEYEEPGRSFNFRTRLVR